MLKHKPAAWLLLIVLISGILSSCKNTTEITPEPENSEPYPYPAASTNEVTITTIESTKRAYPIEEATAVLVTPIPASAVVPTPGKDTGVVTGRLIFTGTDKPVQENMVYLGFKIYLTPGPDYTFGLTQNNSPHVATDPNGRFILGDVPPGTYFVVLWSLSGASLATLPGKTESLEITVKPGEVLDLGTLEVNPIGSN